MAQPDHMRERGGKFEFFFISKVSEIKKFGKSLRVKLGSVAQSDAMKQKLDANSKPLQ